MVKNWKSSIRSRLHPRSPLNSQTRRLPFKFGTRWPGKGAHN